MLANQRPLFDLPDDVAYFNCAYMGPLPRAARDAGDSRRRPQSPPWEIGVRDFFDPSEKARRLFAGLIGATADDVVIVPAASYGLAVAAANLPLEAGEAILLLAEQFPSNVYVWREKAAEAGAEIVTVPRPEDDDWTRAVLERLESQGQDRGRAPLPLDRRRPARPREDRPGRRGCKAPPWWSTPPRAWAPCLSTSQAIQPDFVAAAAYKWLLGPYSVGFLYVAPRHQGGKPLEQSWITRAGADDFAALVQYQDDFAPGARRYDQGESANIQLTPAAIASLELIHGWGVANIQEALAEKTAKIAAGAAELGIASAPANRRAGHFVGLRFAGGIPAGLPEKLAAAKVYASVRGSSLRVTPHLYNTDEDIEKLLAVLRRV